MAEEFPIIRFEQRKVDNGKTPGSGDSRKPKWVLSGQSLIKHGEKLTADIQRIDSAWEFNLENKIPKAIEVEFIENAKAKTHQSKIIDLFTVNDQFAQIGMSSEYSLLVKINNQSELNVVKDRLSEIERYDIQISAIEKVSEYSPEITLENDRIHYKLDFLDYQDKEINERVQNYVLGVLERNGIAARLSAYGKRNVLEVTESNLDKLRFIRELPIKGMAPMEVTMPPFPFLEVEVFERKNLVEFSPEKEYPTIGLLDSGVEINPITKDWVIQGEGALYADRELNKGHGTYIASLLIHGNKLNNNDDTTFEGCKIIDVPIVPKYPISGPQLIKNIETAIVSNPEVKIWSLSVSLDGEIQNNRFSDFAIELDRIQLEHNVLIFKSAGNDPSFYSGGIAGKLSIGADSVRSVTVGSINRQSDEFLYSIANYPSPYSRVGRGPAHIVKPELVHFGGDVLALNSNPTAREEFQVIGDLGFSTGAMEERQIGTSFSTPKVAKLAAEIDMLLEGEFDPLLLKALLIHSATYSENPIMKSSEKLNKMGYGKPEHAVSVLSDDTHTVTLLLQGDLLKGENIDIMDFPYPKSLIKNGLYTGRIKSTLVYNPYLEGNLGDEYCQSNLKLNFGTFSRKFDREGRYQLFNPIGRENSKNVLNSDLFAKRKMRENVEYGVERLQIKYGDKYYPVKKYDCNLSELRLSNEKYIQSDRNWYLFIEGQYRDFITKKFQKMKKVPSMQFCLIITIEDVEKEVDVYNGTVRELDANNFNYAEVVSEINIEVKQDMEE